MFEGQSISEEKQKISQMSEKTTELEQKLLLDTRSGVL